jgi:hypothetical protein
MKRGVSIIHTPIKGRGDRGYGLATLSVLSRASVAEPVATVTLDQLVESLNLQAVHLLKPDIEGFEAALIACGARTIERHRPAILLGMSDPLLRRSGSSPVELWARLVAFAYAPLHLRDGTDSLNPCDGAPSDGDAFWLPHRKS